MNRAICILVATAFWLVAMPAFALDTELLIDGGPSDNRIDIVVVGDGYTISEQEKFRDDAELLMNYFLGVEPFNDYSSHFNVHLVYVISNESGADHPSRNVYVDTALDATYEAYDIDRLLVVDNGKALTAASEVSAVDVVFAIVNDSEYGGSGGQVAVSSTHAQAPEIITHEIGHMLADLADEYEDAYPGYPSGDYEANVTYQTESANIPWNVWLTDGVPLPTPETNDYAHDIGLFEGARYLSSGIYRPRLDCKMRSLGVPFCEVCAEQIVYSNYDYIDPSDAPNDQSWEVGPGQARRIDAMPIQTEDNALDVAWTVDGNAAGTTNGRLVLYGDELDTGNHEVTASIVDHSEWIRRPEVLQLAQTTRTFWVEKVADTVSDGDIVDGDFTDGDTSDGDVTDGDTTDGDTTDGDATDGDTTDGDVTDGDTTDGDMTDGDVTDGDITDGDATDGDTTDGDVWVVDGDIEDGDFAEGDFPDEDSSGCQQNNGSAGLWLMLIVALVLSRRYSSRPKTHTA